MEDRDTPALYLELVDIDEGRYLDERARRVLDAPGVARLTCWTNLVPDRTDLPRRLDEFGWLAVYEADRAFRPPSAVAGVRGLHFVRTARPGQGRLVDEPTTGLLLVLISPKAPDQAEALRAWADFVHISGIAAVGVPNYAMITPYESVDATEPRFLHFYEMTTAHAEGAFQAMTPLVAERLGGYDTDAFSGWANHEALLIDYVSTFGRTAEVPAGRA